MRKMQGRRGFVVNDFILRMGKEDRNGFTIEQWRHIIRKLNKALADDLVDDTFVDLPCKMGRIIITRRQRLPYLASDGTIRRPRAKADWKRMRQAWKDYPNEKISSVILEGENFYIKYFPNTHGKYINMTYFDRDYTAHRELTKRIGRLFGEDKIALNVERHTRRPVETWIHKKDTHR